MEQVLAYRLAEGAEDETASVPREAGITGSMALSAVLHAAAILLALSLRFSLPEDVRSETPPPILIAPVPYRPPARIVPVPARRTITPARSEPRVFHAPAPPVRTIPQPELLSLPAIPNLELPHVVVPAADSAGLSLPRPQLRTDNLGEARIGAAPPTAAPRSLAGGFSSPEAAGAGPAPRTPPPVRAFGNATVVSPRSAGAAAPAPATAVEILSKPRPMYTEEARRLQIEGEVLLQVLFAANGEVRVLQVVRGLGHGLDESARQAAANIRFRPALRDGSPVDTTAIVHIVFELAY